MLESWFFAQENESANEKSGNKETDGINEYGGSELLEGGKGGCKIQLNTLIEESKKNAVSGVNFKIFKLIFHKFKVIAENLPDITESILADPELQDSLR
jgi:hypothetical protein